MSTYAFGAGVRLDTTVKDDAGAPVTPTTISLSILLPDGSIGGPFSPTVDGAGIYHYDFGPAQAGRHVARWVTTGPVGAKETPFEVAAIWAEAGIISLDDAKHELNIDADDTSDDVEILDKLRSVTAVCEDRVGALVRTVHVEAHRGGNAYVLAHPPVLSVTSVTSIGSGAAALDVAGLHVDGQTGIVRSKGGGPLPGDVDVSYVAGRTSIPSNVDQAARILLQHLWETQRGTMGGVRAGGSDDGWDPRFGFTVPRRVQELLTGRYPGIA
jgi:hypothetical protein